MDGLWWLLILVGPLLLLQRRLHYETQAVFLLLTRSREITIVLYALLFFPGVLLHEGSHFLMARLLGVRTGRFSIFPRATAPGRLQLGFVETASTDLVRDALIGVAPLLVGGAVVAYAGLARLGLPAIWQAIRTGQAAGILEAVRALPERPDFWLWLYVAFAVSSTMLPSASDRRAWAPLALAVAAVVGLGLLVGAGPWLRDTLASPLNEALRALAVVIGITVGVHLALLPPIWALHRALSRLTGLKVQ